MQHLQLCRSAIRCAACPAVTFFLKWNSCLQCAVAARRWFSEVERQGFRWTCTQSKYTIKQQGSLVGDALQRWQMQQQWPFATDADAPGGLLWCVDDDSLSTMCVACLSRLVNDSHRDHAFMSSLIRTFLYSPQALLHECALILLVL